MREIGFRGKRVKNGAWIYGNMINDSIWIYGNLVYTQGITGEWTVGIQQKSGDGYRAWATLSVDPSTVGQYTGLKDRNGVEIYEGDIIKYTWDGTEKIDYVEYGAPMFSPSKTMRWSLGEDEVIGSIHDNPELLEVL